MTWVAGPCPQFSQIPSGGSRITSSGAKLTFMLSMGPAAANLLDMRFHDLRHSCATLLLVQGVAPRVVMEISLTMNTYSHVMPAVQEEAAARLEELVRRSPSEAAQE
jgi:integrase